MHYLFKQIFHIKFIITHNLFVLIIFKDTFTAALEKEKISELVSNFEYERIFYEKKQFKRSHPVNSREIFSNVLNMNEEFDNYINGNATKKIAINNNSGCSLTSYINNVGEENTHKVESYNKSKFINNINYNNGSSSVMSHNNESSKAGISSDSIENITHQIDHISTLNANHQNIIENDSVVVEHNTSDFNSNIQTNHQNELSCNGNEN